jgi:hypothetical protein
VRCDAAGESTLFAQVVTLGPLDFGVQHVGWSVDGAGGEHLIVMRGPADDACCLVTGYGTVCGGVVAFTVERGRTPFVLTPEAAGAIGMAPRVTLRYDPRAVNAADLRGALLDLVRPDTAK